MNTDAPPPPLDYRTPGLPSTVNERLRRPLMVVGLTVAGLLLAGVAVAMSTPHLYIHPTAPHARCASNEHQLGLGILLYQQDHGGHYPDSLAAILSAEQIGADVMICPDSNDIPATLPPPPAGEDRPTTRQAAAALAVPGHLSYVYVGHADWTDANVPADAVVIYEPIANHGGGSNMLFGDGHAQFVDARRAAKLIAAASATTRPVSAAAVP